MTKFILVFLMLIITSCVSVKPINAPPSPAIVEQPVSLTVFPINPTLKNYSRKPVIEAIDNNYMVSDEFVENALKYKAYHDKVIRWKDENEIK
jgi:hypothetical protein